MSIEHYFKQAGVVHSKNCSICSLEPRRTVRNHVWFWFVVDVVLAFITAYIALKLITWIIQSIVSTQVYRVF